MDLIRELILKLEAMPYGLGVVHELTPGEGAMEFAGFSTDEIAYHLQLLVESGQLVTLGGNLDGNTYFERLSITGHDFADSVRSPEVWAKTRKGAEAAGGFTVDLLKDLAKAFIKKQIKDKTGLDL